MPEHRRRADTQLNVRMERATADLIRRAFPRRGELTSVVTELLLSEAQARLAAQSELPQEDTAA